MQASPNHWVQPFSAARVCNFMGVPSGVPALLRARLGRRKQSQIAEFGRGTIVRFPKDTTTQAILWHFATQSGIADLGEGLIKRDSLTRNVEVR
ncbi:hypothetical protein DSM25559_5075 [Agrobacterium rosae]|uniref:Uncharacterized protein n=1 Tax=Agrobacterium rosae TaxID=1972867 RepID=A0A1R3U2E5_9HYPH|nr:hypothetical protein DSM25559_5075 [Agrobacterium rosae]